MATTGYVTKLANRFFWCEAGHTSILQPFPIGQTRQIVGATVQVVEIHEAEETRYCILTLQGNRVTQTFPIYDDGSVEVTSFRITGCDIGAYLPDTVVLMK